MRTRASITVFLTLVLLGLLLADKPPPPGFLLWVAVCACAGGFVWWRSSVWIEHPLLGVRDGGFAGIISALVIALAPGGEPTVRVEWYAYLIWFAVACLAGATFGGIVAWLLHRTAARPQA